jgi:hypothetical protein
MAAWLSDYDGDLSRSVIVARPSVLVNIGILGNYQRLGAKGGELLGVTAIASRNAPDNLLIILDPARIALLPIESKSDHRKMHPSNCPTIRRKFPMKSTRPDQRRRRLSFHAYRATRLASVGSYLLIGTRHRVASAC